MADNAAVSNTTHSVASAAGTKSSTKAVKAHNPHATRETFESIIIAFILAFLFRAFVAEAFVIPTGSMAPTLMGAHKDTVCEHCGTLYPSTASHEFDNDSRASLTDAVAVGSTCPNCRAVNAFDLAGNKNHRTFSGDRILVSKFDYLFGDPDRWDVLVFKYPTDARMNYIKRLVGLPGEHLHIEGGDVYVSRQNQPLEMARKPPDKALAMMQIVSDTRHQARDLVARGWPSLWQPDRIQTAIGDAQPADSGNWQVQQEVDNWSAQLPPGSAETKFLRYYHKYLDKTTWQLEAEAKAPLNIDPYSSSLVTDFLAYNTTSFGPRSEIYDPPARRGAWGFLNFFSSNQGQLKDRITSENRALGAVSSFSIRYMGLAGSLPTFAGQARPVGFLSQEGMHWVGDLSAEFDVELSGQSGSITLDVVEFGIRYSCTLDVSTGQATWRASDDGRPLNVFSSQADGELVVPTARTSIKGPGRHRVRVANVDDQLMLWIDGSLVSFDHAPIFDSHRFRTGKARRPYWKANDPLDAAPLAIGGQGVGLHVRRAQVWRDIYYIAVSRESFSEYREDQLRSTIASLPDAALRAELSRAPEAPQSVIAWLHARPEMWERVDLFDLRGSMDFQLEEGQFFPMGDNSAASSDARVWGNRSYVDRRFLIGKALLVFWPHGWNAPIPYPNFPRMGRIR